MASVRVAFDISMKVCPRTATASHVLQEQRDNDSTTGGAQMQHPEIDI
jgi:hypothetical protein